MKDKLEQYRNIWIGESTVPALVCGQRCVIVTIGGCDSVGPSLAEVAQTYKEERPLGTIGSKVRIKLTKSGCIMRLPLKPSPISTW